MGITFTRAPEVTPGSRPTSSQMSAIARAFNDRMLSGVGDAARRVAWYLFNAWRQIRNPDSSGLVFPTQAEYFEVWQHLDPDRSDATWPIAEPGDNEGTNLANNVAAFVHGNESLTLAAEADRLQPPHFPLVASGYSGLEAYWMLAQMQRGAIDPTTGAQAWPAGEAAQAWFKVASPQFGRLSPWNQHGKSWGGFLPAPETILTDCGTTEETGLSVPSYAIKFTAMAPGVSAPTGHHGTASTTTIDGQTRAVVTYPGSCPCWTSETTAGHVLAVYQGLRTYYVLVNTGGPGSCPGIAVDAYPLEEWLEGPYEAGGQLQHTEGRQIARFISSFAGDFRGTPAQRTPDTFRIKTIAFPFEEFLGRQYALAPALAYTDGPDLLPVYPAATWTGATTFAPGTLGTILPGSATSYTTPAGFVIAGAYAKASGLTAPATVDILEGANRLAALALVPDEYGNAEAIAYFPAAAGNLRFSLPAGAQFSSTSGQIRAEAAVLADYLPEFHDAYAVLRLSAASNGGQVDGRGPETDNAQTIGQEFLERGAIVSAGPVDDFPHINRNPVFDAARRMTRDALRVLSRRQFVAYEVTGGKSILYLKRFCAVPAANGIAEQIDVLEGIAPPLDPIPSGDLVEGEVYLVRGSSGDSITYAGNTYTPGQEFTAGASPDYTTAGAALVYVKDGIRQAARKRGWSNRWCAFPEWKRYHPSNSSIWKPDAYADYFAWCDRCHFYSGSVPVALRRQIGFNESNDVDPSTGLMSRLAARVQAQMMAPESMTGYRYALGANDGRYEPNPEEFRKSCRIYEPPLELESCTVSDWGENPVCKLTFKTRFHSHASAPSTWSATPPTWPDGNPKPQAVLDLEAEDYRTDDNAWRSYHIHLANPHWHADVKTGDSGQGSIVDGLPDNPFGSCYPSLFLVSLIPEPFDDGNDLHDGHDTRRTARELERAELYLRAMCEGFIDGQTSLDLVCRPPHDSGLFDFTFENLCFEAFGGRWIGAVGEALRPDNPEGFGPLPNTRPHADVWNRLAKSVNLLTRARLELPVEVYSKTTVRFNEVPVSIGPGSCGGGGAWQDDVSPRTASTIQSQDLDWVLNGGMTASQIDEFSGCPWSHATTVQTFVWKAEVPADILHAIPPDLQAHVTTNGVGIAAGIETTVSRFDRQTTTTPGQPCGDVFPCHPFYDGANYHEWLPDVVTVHDCLLMDSGTITAPIPPNSDYWAGGCGSGYIECRGGAATSVSVTPFAVQMPFITIPLVDP